MSTNAEAGPSSPSPLPRRTSSRSDQVRLATEAFAPGNDDTSDQLASLDLNAALEGYGTDNHNGLSWDEAQLARETEEREYCTSRYPCNFKQRSFDALNVCNVTQMIRKQTISCDCTSPRR